MIKSEICIESYAGAKIAANLGYTSVEVNAALNLGGLTPSLGLVRQLAQLNIEKNCMLRPRAGGFCYTESEYTTMLADLEILLREKIDGVVFGFLTEEFLVDKDRTKQVVDIIHQANKKAIFHRAFDNTADAELAIQTLIDLGVDRLLTSGQKETALEGASLLAKLQAKYGRRIEIVAGAGIKAANVLDLIKRTKLNYIHASCKTFSEDITSVHNVSYAVDSERASAYISTGYEQALALKEAVISYEQACK